MTEKQTEVVENVEKKVEINDILVIRFGHLSILGLIGLVVGSIVDPLIGVVSLAFILGLVSWFDFRFIKGYYLDPILEKRKIGPESPGE